MVRPDIVYPAPSNVPLNGDERFPTGAKPAPPFHVTVAAASTSSTST
jgi:hypothetical protein